MSPLPSTAAVIRALSADPPSELCRAGVTLPDVMRQEFARVLAHCLIRDAEADMERKRAEQEADPPDEDFTKLAAELGVTWDAEYGEFTGCGMWAAKRHGSGWKIWGSPYTFSTARAALIAWRAR